jgi:hypothetical protein
MNWTHSGAGMRALGFVWVVAAILVVADASLEVWLACGITGMALGVVNALQSDRHPDGSARRQFKPFSFRRQPLPRFRTNIVSDRFPTDRAAD